MIGPNEAPLPGSRAVIIYSGGMDSTVLLYEALAQLRERAFLRVLSFNYGQRHAKELDVASRIVRKLGLAHLVVNLSSLRELLGSSSLTSSLIDVPHGHYEAESMQATVVPNRNAIMLSVAIGFAASIEFNYVAYAAHSGDHAIYPDCRPEFVEAIDRVASFAGGARPVELWAPFIHKTKADIARRGYLLNAPLHETWSCYEGRELHCGKCGTCVERREAFALAGIEDSTRYFTEANTRS